MKKIIPILCATIAMLVSTSAFSQVSNDNEDEVNKVDERQKLNFVPGQAIVKFKDESSVQVKQNSQGRFRAASINAVDEILREFGVDEMEKLFPAEMPKPQSQLRRKAAPNGQVVQESNLDKIFWIKTGVMSADSTMQMVKHLQALSDVEYAEPNYYAYITAEMPTEMTQTYMPTEEQKIRKAASSIETTASVICSNPSQNPLYFRQYGIPQQNIHKLWNKPIINKKRPVIAILDTGVDITHPDLADNIWTNIQELEGETAYDDDNNGIVDDEHGWNFVDNYYDLTDRNGHGTHVAGIAAAADNNLGIIGANPLALIMPIKVMNDKGVGDIATICRGIAYAAENGADVINMSFGSSALYNTMKDALDKAYQTAVLVASAGNNGKNIYDDMDPSCSGTSYPAAYYLVLGVEASASNLQRAVFSNYDPDGPIYSEDGIDGRNYEVMVPGDKIYSTLLGGKYNQLSGTSMSSPLLAGAISALQMVKEYPSKDVLYGDLIHLKADFEKIYSDDTPRTPKIDLVSLSVDDNVEGNSNIDGQVDVGETIKFTPVLRNTWADATDINLQLSVDPIYTNFVQIENPEVPFGYSLSAYGRAAAQVPITVRFDQNIGDNTRIKFVLTVSCSEGTESFTQDVYVTVNNIVKISGLISEDRTLTADHVYLVNENIGIMEGATLTIEPGTRLEFEEGTKLSSFGKLFAKGTPEKPIVFTGYNGAEWAGITSHESTGQQSQNTYENPRDTISYCIISNHNYHYGDFKPYMKDCILYLNQYRGEGEFTNIEGVRNNYIGGSFHGLELNSEDIKLFYSNIVNNDCGWPPSYCALGYINYINNYWTYYWDGKYKDRRYSIGTTSSAPDIEKSNNPSYLGTGREDIIRPYIFEIGNAPDTYGQIDLSNMRTTPIAEAHGIVWKVCVNGKDAQDEYEDLAPLGVGKHKFEVYFNRPMNKEVAPNISFGVREPYTQNAVTEDGSWNDEGTIYTAYKTITGKTKSDGVNRIYVYGAEDNEFFECPYEKTRFNVMINAAGSMATGFAAEAGLGRVNLTWDNSHNDFEDAMGFNIYRFNEVERMLPVLDEGGNEIWEYDEEGNRVRKEEMQTVMDTICINKDIVDIETTEYTDYDVTPSTTYYYMYKVLSTDLQEYDVSNVVAATPLTSTLGDANGSGEVDVADVITTVNYAAGMDPKPFIFEAADMNADTHIDILDVVGIIQEILNPTANTNALVEAIATYTVEDGIVYVESPVALAGVQVQLNAPGQNEPSALETLNGFEHASAWLTDEDYLFLGYNMSGKTIPAGKHALFNIGGAQLRSIRLSDTMGSNVMTEAGNVTAIEMQAAKVLPATHGIYNLNGQKVAGSAEDLKRLPKGVYVVDGVKVVKTR